MGTISCSQNIKATPAQIWAIISDVTRLPDWAYTEGRIPYPVEGKFGSDQTEGVGTIWIGVSADGQKAIQKITAWEPPSQLTYELEEVENAPAEIDQTNTLRLEPTSEGTKVTWEVHWELKGGFSLTNLITRFTANGAFEEMMVGSLENLQRLAEQEAD